jgi:Zn-dependent peptidase ImmA (M78 family)
MAKTLAYAKPEVLRWARESAGYDVFQAAEKIGIPWSQLEIAEEGVDYLTLRQAEKAADVYERPVAALFLPAPLDEPPQEAVFRRLPDAPKPPWPPEMQLLQRRVRMRQAAAADLYEDLEETPAWPGAARRFRDAVGAGRPRASALAAVARELLGVTREAQTEWARADEYAPLRGWIGAVESIGVLVMQDGSMQLDLMRGFASIDDAVPAVVLNTNDNPRARTFTVLHELAHLAFLAAGAGATEVRANDFAGEVVMPRERLAEEFRALSGRSLVDRVDALARAFGVTPLAAAVRLRRANLTPSDQAGQVIGVLRTRTRPPRQSRRGQYYYRTIASLGPAYIRLVFSALDSGAVSYPTASTLLGNVRVDNFETLREHVSRRG